MSKWMWLNLLTFSRADCRRLNYSIKFTSKETFQTCGFLLDHFLYSLHVWEKEIDLPLMISRGHLCHWNNMWISFGSLLVFPARVVSKVVFDGNLGLDYVISCWLLPALTAVICWCKLWQLLKAVASFDSSYKLSTTLKALASFDSSYKLSLALIPVKNCCKLWQLLQAVGSYTSTSLQHQHCLNIWFYH